MSERRARCKELYRGSDLLPMQWQRTHRQKLSRQKRKSNLLQLSSKGTFEQGLYPQESQERSLHRDQRVSEVQGPRTRQ